MRDRRKGGFLLAAGVIFVAVSVFVKDSYYANILRSWGIAWAVIGFLRLREYFYYNAHGNTGINIHNNSSAAGIASRTTITHFHALR